MNLNEIIEQCQTGDPEATAEGVRAALNVPQKWWDLFGALVTDQCRRSYRSHVRDSEISPGGQCGPDHHRSSAAGGPNRTDYLAERFYNGTEYVCWGTATVADHRARIAYLAALRNGIDSTIQKHADAIALIESHGADCLNNVREVAA